MIPKDPVMLLSFVNMKLRDEYADMDELCDKLDVSRAEIDEKLSALGYTYKRDINQYK